MIMTAAIEARRGVGRRKLGGAGAARSVVFWTRPFAGVGLSKAWRACRLDPGGRPGAAKECLGGGQVSPFTKQHVDHLAVLIDGAVQVPLDGAPETSVYYVVKPHSL